MNLPFPESDSVYLLIQAGRAGFDSVEEYVLTLARLNEAESKSLESIAQDPMLERLLVEGLESGPSEPLDLVRIRRGAGFAG